MRIGVAQLGNVGLAAVHLAGLQALGITDTDVLQPGQVITFTVHGGFPCSGIWEADVRDTLNNWAGEMMQINSVTTSALGNVPSVVDVNINATVKKAVTAGSLRGQIVASLAALSSTKFYTTCVGGVSLASNVINVAAGGTNSANTCPTGYVFNAQGQCVPPDNGLGGFSWSTIAIAGGLGLAGVIVLVMVLKR